MVLSGHNREGRVLEETSIGSSLLFTCCGCCTIPVTYKAEIQKQRVLQGFVCTVRFGGGLSTVVTNRG